MSAVVMLELDHEKVLANAALWPARWSGLKHDMLKHDMLKHDILKHDILCDTSRLGAVNLADTPTRVSEQVINIEDAVYAYTMASAYANFCEDNRGSISPGKYADLVVLSQDIYRGDPDQIKDTNIDLTMVDGEIAYS
jgi:adenine deaminase